MQLKAAREIKTLSEGRQISFNSSNIVHYEPDSKQKDIWDEAYYKYLKVLKENYMKK